MSSDLNKQVHNLQSFFLGTARLFFADGATTPAIAAVQGYRDLGKILSLSMQSDKKEVQHMGFYSGKKRLDKTVVVESSFKFTFNFDELTASKMATMPTTSIRRGIFRIMPGNQEPTNTLGLEFSNFYGELRVNGNTSVDGANFGELEFVIDVLNA